MFFAKKNIFFAKQHCFAKTHFCWSQLASQTVWLSLSKTKIKCFLAKINGSQTVWLSLSKTKNKMGPAAEKHFSPRTLLGSTLQGHNLDGCSDGAGVQTPFPDGRGWQAAAAASNSPRSWPVRLALVPLPGPQGPGLLFSAPLPAPQGGLLAVA